MRDRAFRFKFKLSAGIGNVPRVLPPCPGRERQKVLVREDAFRTVSDTWKDRASGLVSLKGRELTVHFSDPAKRDEFFNWPESRKTKFPDAPPSVDAMEQLELFGEQ